MNAPADGYTLLLITNANATNTTLYPKLNFNFIRDIRPIASIARGPDVMVVHPSFPAKTVPEFIDYAKANPGKINMASAGNGSGPHMAGELFKMMTGLDMIHVPYRGGTPAFTDLLGGQVQVMFPNIAPAVEYVRTGKLRALGVSTTTRSDALPDISAIATFLPGYEAGDWFGIAAPTKTPADIVDKLNNQINACLADPTMKARFAGMGLLPLGGSPAEFGNFISDETEKWGKVVKFAGLKAE